MRAWMVLAWAAMLPGCGLTETAATAGAGAAAKAQEARQAQQTMQTVQENMDQVKNLSGERADKAADEAANE